MKFYINQLFSILTIALILTACGGEGSENLNEYNEHSQEEAGQHAEGTEAVHFSAEQFRALDMQVGKLPLRNISSVVQANGQLEVPPQNEATVTAIIGANVASIKVIEGDDVKKGQVLAYLSHPAFTRMQNDYLEAYNRLQYLEQEYQRQKRLYEEEVGSGKDFQQTQRDYQLAQGTLKSLKSQLSQLGVNPSRIQEGEFYEQMPVTSPIDGSIVKVEVRIGQFVPPEKDLFEIINTHHIHADLMVFEKDVFKIKEGQRVRFTVETLPGKELFAEIYSVGKKFEQAPKAVHVHAEIENKTENLIPGMYIKGEILTDNAETFALPEGAVTREGDQFFTFLAEKELEGEEESWMFTPMQVIPGVSNKDWVAVEFLEQLPEQALFVMNNAYYLLAEMKKGEAEHSH